MFTGSNKTGKTVLKAAAEQMIPCYLELGGKDPMIVLRRCRHRARRQRGRVLRDEQRRPGLHLGRARVRRGAGVRRASSRRSPTTCAALRQGAPAGVGTVDVGAVTFPPQIEIVDAHVQDAVHKGAKVADRWPQAARGGRFYEPTVLVDVDHSMKIMQDETFGPTLPIMRVADAEEGVRLANDSAYGLQASVWTSDTERGEALARRIEAGVVCVNDAQINYTALNLPMGGWKASGLGTRHGAQGIRKYTKVQSLLVTKRALKREPFMFPYRARRTMLLRRFFKLFYGRGSRD